MHPSLLRELQARRFSTRARWEALLHAEPVVTPLGLPAALVHLIDKTLEEVFTQLDRSSLRLQTHGRAASHQAICPCGRNPLLAYFTAAEQALREGLVLCQAACAPIDPGERDTAIRELDAVLTRIAKREIQAFCGLCQFRLLSLPAPVPILQIQGG